MVPGAPGVRLSVRFLSERDSLLPQRDCVDPNGFVSATRVPRLGSFRKGPFGDVETHRSGVHSPSLRLAGKHGLLEVGAEGTGGRGDRLPWELGLFGAADWVCLVDRTIGGPESRRGEFQGLTAVIPSAFGAWASALSCPEGALLNRAGGQETCVCGRMAVCGGGVSKVHRWFGLIRSPKIGKAGVRWARREAGRRPRVLPRAIRMARPDDCIIVGNRGRSHTILAARGNLRRVWPRMGTDRTGEWGERARRGAILAGRVGRS